MAQATTERVLDELRGRGARITPVRRTLIDVLVRARSHLNADDIASAVRAKQPDVHASTIYRNLDALEDLGVVQHTHLGHRPAVYHLHRDHQHLVCEVCETVIDVPSDLLDDLAETVRKRYGFSLQPGHVALMGRCRKHR